jgi:molybdate transport system substrate-binding protein
LELGKIDDGRIATGDAKKVPVGLYAKAALEKLGVWPSVESKMAMTVNVRAALAYAARSCSSNPGAISQPAGSRGG